MSPPGDTATEKQVGSLLKFHVQLNADELRALPRRVASEWMDAILARVRAGGLPNGDPLLSGPPGFESAARVASPPPPPPAPTPAPPARANANVASPASSQRTLANGNGASETHAVVTPSGKRLDATAPTAASHASANANPGDKLRFVLKVPCGPQFFMAEFGVVEREADPARPIAEQLVELAGEAGRSAREAVAKAMAEAGVSA